jgi:hypothetical protein
LLREEVSVHLHELWAKDGKELMSHQQINAKVSSYEKAWGPYEKRIVQGMCKILDLEFRQNIIDVYIAPWMKGFSDPMVIGVTLKPDEFVDVLTHELLHRLLTDNTTVPYSADLMKEWTKLFGDEHSTNTLLHIPVHAAHKAIYLGVLREPQRFERDRAKDLDLNAKDYVKSWEYVERHGYEQILAKLKDSYKKLSVKHDEVR